MYTDVIISNMALGHVGTAGTIENLQADTQPNAKTCLTFYQVALRHTLRAFEWSFAKKVEPLTKVSTLDVSKYQWRFRYQYPVDAVKFLRINSERRNDTRDTIIPFRRFTDGIYTDRDDAIGQWIVGNVKESFFPDDFALALSHKLAALISPTVTRGDDFKKQEEQEILFMKILSQAEAASANEEQQEIAPASEFERARL